MKITNTHLYFWDTVYSQWYCKPNHSPLFYYNNIPFQTAEHFMMWSKAITFNDYTIADKILTTSHPRDVKALGRKVANFNSAIWDSVCDQIVIHGNLLKFSQNPDLLATIKSQAHLTFVEASPFDTIWGVGLHESDPLILDEANWLGQNKLGKALNQVAKLLQDF